MSQEFYLLDEEEAFQFSTSMDQQEAKRMLRKHAPHLFSEEVSVCQPPTPVQVTEANALEWLRAAKVSPGLERALVYQQWKDGIDIDVPTSDLMSLFRAALEAALQAGVPSGYALVPIKPNAAIATAIGDVLDKQDADSGAVCWYTVGEEAWRAGVKAGSLAAAPAPGEGR